MESSIVSDNTLYPIPFNIILCDATEKEKTDALLKLVLTSQYETLKTKELGKGQIAYIHHPFQWLFTSTTLDHLLNVFQLLSNLTKEEISKTMLLFHIDSLNQPETIFLLKIFTVSNQMIIR